MKAISSRENAVYKQLKQLASSAQARRKQGETVLDGIHLCQTYLQHQRFPILCIVGEDAIRNAEVAAIVDACEKQNVSCLSLPSSLFNALSQVENGIELLFVVPVPKQAAPTKMAETAVFLDGVQDPGNLGSILRSAAAAGILQVYCGQGTAAAWSPKVLRAGMGAHFGLHIFENVELGEAINSAAIPVVATSSHAPQSIYQLDLTHPVIWLFGHEGQGVAPDLLKQATHQIAIPHLGQMESLNVAACAAVCFFEQVRQKLS